MPKNKKPLEPNEQNIETAKLRGVFTPDTKREYANHVIVGTTGMDFNFAFGQLTSFAGFLGLTPQKGEEPGSFHVSLVVTTPGTFVPSLTEVLLTQLVRMGVPIEDMVKRVREREA